MRFSAFPLLCLWLLLASHGDAATFDELSARATAAREANDIPRAIQLYKQALEANPKWQEGWWFLGTFLYGSDQFAGARDAFHQFLSFNPQAGPGWGLLGLCEFQTAEYDLALADIQRSFSLGMSADEHIGPVLRYHEALLLTRAGEFEKALGKFSPLMRAGESAPLITGLGLAGLRRPLVPKEIPADQQDLITSAGKAMFFLLSGDSKRANEHLQDLLRRYPAAANVHYLYGCYLLQYNPDGAIEEFRREMEITPGNPAAASMLALNLSAHGDFEPAVEYAQKAAAGAPKSSSTIYALGRVLVEAGKPAQGIQHLEQAAKMDPANVEGHATLATAYAKVGRYSDAKRERQKTMELLKESDAAAQR